MKKLKQKSPQKNNNNNNNKVRRNQKKVQTIQNKMHPLSKIVCVGRR